LAEAQLEQTENGLVPNGDGWFVLNARDAAWLHVDELGEERKLRAWDLVHCPPGVAHVIVGAGGGAVPRPRRRRPSRG